MDQRNGPIFDHHDELFAQIGAADAEQALKDFVLDSSGLLDMTGSVAPTTNSAPLDMWSHCPPRPPDPLNFNMLGNCNDGNMMNSLHQQRGMFHPNDVSAFDVGAGNMDPASAAFLDTLVKTMPDDMLDGYHSLEAIKRSLMNIPDKNPHHGLMNHPADIVQPPVLPALLDTMHRISTDKCTQEYLDTLSKPSDNDGREVCNNADMKLMDHSGWNGMMNNIDNSAHFQSRPTNKSVPEFNSFLSAIDKNGNCPTVFNNGLHDKGKHNFMVNSLDGITRDLPQSYLVKGVSPSVSAESGIHTPTTCYDSSPLSSGRTPLLSDDSISPLTSCASPVTSVRTPASPLPRTPLRTDDCFSPGRVRRIDTSPMVRTPLRCDEAPSPRPVSRTPLRGDEAPSPRAVARTPLRNDDAASPRGVSRTPLRGDDAHSPRPIVRTPLRGDDAHSPRPIVRTPLRGDDAHSPRPLARTPLRTDGPLSPRPIARTPLRTDESPSPRATNWNPVCSDEALSPRTVNRTPVRTEETPCRTPLGSDEVPSPRLVNRTPTRAEVSPLARSVQSPLSRTDTSPRNRVAFSPGSSNVSPQAVPPQASPRRTPRQPLPSPKPDTPPARRENETAVASEPRLEQPTPDLQAGPEPVPVSPRVPVPGSSAASEVSPAGPSDLTVADPAQLPATEADKLDSKPRKRRKTDSLCVPTPKKRWKKKPSGTPIYQSSVSGEESGIKLKIKLATLQPPKKRKRRTGPVEPKPGKRRKRSTPEPGEQSPWGQDIPPHVLECIFQQVVDDEGCVPSLVRYSRVCRLWNTIANKSELWQNVDLSSPCIKQKCKIDRYFRWLLENRLGTLRDLNLNGWKFSNLPMVLSLIGTHCSEVESIGLSGWQGLHFEHLRSLLQDCPRLSRIDLSDVSPESKSTNSAVSPKSITFLTETLGGKLTEIILAHNTLACLQQIISSLASHCPNLQVLDLSNIRRASHAEFALHVEELQQGCPKLRVLRITNSCITLASVPFDQQAASTGFPALEELSIAGHQGTESLRITSVMDDDCLERIVKNSHRLRLLDVRGCTRITDSSLVRVPAWDIQHLFLSGCVVTRQSGSGLELIAQKWSHSLVEVDLAWASVTEDLNAAVLALAERGAESPLRVVNLCGSAVEPEPVRTLLTRCPNLESLNLQSCRGLPRGVKRLYDRDQLPELQELLEQSSKPDGDR